MAQKQGNAHFFAANDPNIQYVGRIDFSNRGEPRFWAPGAYIMAKFSGRYFSFIINDEAAYGHPQNYIEIVIDGQKKSRIKITAKTDTIQAAERLTPGTHTICICKDTESQNGWLSFAGFYCEALLTPAPLPSRKIEFIGNSITCGSASDLSQIPCGKGQWYDQHNAYLGYGPSTARNLDAQWQLSAVSGIGLVHSCCEMTIAMPQVFDKMDMQSDSIAWDFSRYQPDVVTICLGQNDGIQDSALFCGAYNQFIAKLRVYYPHADIICITSPMAGPVLTAAMKNYLTAIVSYNNAQGDKKVHSYFFTKRYNHGCGGHPDVNEHQQIAQELTLYIKGLMQW
jgi:Carbohydrate esterase 2 N-terminal/GDSL-like Lipase/Acylhydrolase family